MRLVLAAASLALLAACDVSPQRPTTSATPADTATSQAARSGSGLQGAGPAATTGGAQTGPQVTPARR